MTFDAIGIAGSALTVHRIVMQATGLALMLVAARFLSPAEFGLLGLVVVTAQIQQQIAETGWFEYVTNWPTDKPLPPEAFFLSRDPLIPPTPC
jgi:hypothetical protein